MLLALRTLRPLREILNFLIIYWKIGRLEEWKIGRMENWKIEILENWKITAVR
jgi:hypothetical protein